MLARLAWRNLWRNRRRTIITITAVVFATWLSLVMRGMQLSTYEQNIAFSLNLLSGHAQLQHPGFADNPTLHNTIYLTPEIEARLDGESRINAWAPRVLGDGLLSYRENSQGAMLLGVDPRREPRVSRILRKPAEGRMLSSGTAAEILLGQTLMENLHARVGEDIVVLAQGYDGSLGNRKFRIVGTVRTGMPDVDRAAVFMGVDALRELLSMRGRSSVVVLSMHDLSEVDAVCATLNTGLDTSAVMARGWQQVMPELQQSIDLDNYSGMLFLGILIIVVAFGILNTVLMSVSERFREFGILLALGMKQQLLVYLVAMETLFITLIGIAIGNVLGFAVNSWFAAHPIVFTGEYAKMMTEYGWLPQMGSVVRLSSFFNTSFAVLLLSLLATMYPLYRVSRLEALKGIRYT